ncbi:ROK family transcriptional regulator [Streptomyces sp. NPDC007076]|uniref:ROK family transcriptional regulator n=1 Tax=unclassified Streptomyces TaxID=2593676 RepID=UPI002E33763A|nr:MULTISPECIES: ROK family transcriptional regulator [unclassified Streptomyces]MEE1746196.1 ROK family transcriptional regulator [Streptomyces sp. JV184]MEE1841675.1 ROK family transcriptional regulator [Streptomyces sp. JV190]
MTISGGDTSRLRRINLVTTLRALRGQGPLSLTEVTKRTGLSRPTVESLTEELLGSGWLKELPPHSGHMGRPARLFSFHSTGDYVLGIDIGSYSIRAAVADLDGTVVASRTEGVSADAGRAVRLAAVRATAAGALESAAVGCAQLAAVCVGTTGVVSHDGLVKRCVGLPEWDGLDLAGEMAVDFDCPVLVENDCNLAALTEGWIGEAQGVDDVAFVLSGVRTGAGLLIGGRVHRGRGGAAGEIGALPLVGWHRATSHLTGYPKMPPDILPQEAAEYVFARARTGEPAARWAVEQYAHDLAEGIAALVLALDPELVVIGGGVSRSGDVLLEPLRRHLDPLCLEPPALAVSSLSDQAVVLGAVRLALDHVDARLYDVDTVLPEPSS